MLREMTYQKKFELLAPLLPSILEAIKKDIRQEHLLKDKNFAKVYFPGQQIQKVSINELAPAYLSAISKEDGEKLGEFIAVRWILKNADIYHFFEKHLKEINPKFEELDILDDEKAAPLLHESIAQFGAIKTYLFSIINSVVFSEKLYQLLKSKADQEKSEQVQKSADKKAIEEPLIEEIKKNHAQDLKKIADKYEKKLSGLQAKYLNDTDKLKKQIGQLQRKLQGQV